MNKFFAIILAVLSILALAITGCGTNVSTTSPVSTPTATVATKPTLTTTDPPLTISVTPSVSSIANTTPDGAAMDKIVLDFIRSTSTFKFDGIEDSITFIKSDLSPISSFRSMDYTLKFQTRHPGHGDRSGMMLAEVITEHTARVYFDIDQKVVRIAVCDQVWDLIKDRELPVNVSGYVISSVDTAQPGGPLDVPHTFVYRIKKDDGSLVDLRLTQYPPSPVGDAAGAALTLELYAGSIQIGDRIYASGMLDKATGAVVIDRQGGYIRTEVPRLQAVGQIISGGDTTPADLKDSPRRFVYTLQKENGLTLDFSYTVYPPSPAGNIKNAALQLIFYNEGLKAGDWVNVYGTYDVITNTIKLSEQGDFLKSYPTRP